METDVAVESDIPALCTLLDSLFSQEVEFKSDYETQARGLKCVIENETVGDILVARSDGEVIGMINLLYTISTAMGARVGILEDMVISAQHRGMGVGSTLIKYALDYAEKNGCKRMTLLTDDDNNGAHKFYQKHGFTRSSMVVFRKPIE